jgi:hypothetical protein
MKTSTFIPEDQLISRAIDVLIERLGPVETSRFLTLPRQQRLESVKRHHQWQATLQKDAFFDTIFGEQ